MKTSELIGSALDWAVAEIEFQQLIAKNCHVKLWVLEDHKAGKRTTPYSTDWAQGGPIIDRELVSVEPKFRNATIEYPNGYWEWQASCVTEDDKAYWSDGPTPLIAAMRCYVASKLGDGVDIPKELL